MSEVNKQTASSDYLKPEMSEAVRENQFILDEHFDRDYAMAMIEKLGNICHDTYFRSTFVDFDENPERNHEDTPFIFISNHSGMAFPWDGMVFISLYNHKLKFGKDSFRVLVAPMLSESTLMNPYLIKDLWKRMGGIDATYLNFETLMHQKEFNVMMYPEGVPGIGKGFNRKYQLQKFHTSYVRMAVKYRTDLHWVSVINGEYINPYSYSFDSINKIVNKIGVPFLPVSLILIGLVLQPWIFYFAFPAKLHFVRGPKIKPYEMIDKPYDEISQEEFVELSAKIRAIAQQHMDESLEKYDKPHFAWRELFSTMWKNRKYFPFYLPTLWPLIYTDFDRRYRKNGNADFDTDLSWWGMMKMMFNNPIFFAYFIPLIGWIPLLIKGYSGNRINENEKRKASTNYS